MKHKMRNIKFSVFMLDILSVKCGRICTHNNRKGYTEIIRK